MFRNKFIFMVLASLFLFSTGLVHSDGWYDDNWKMRQEITVNYNFAGTSPLSDFPLLVKISQPDTEDYDIETDGLFINAQADGDDILFTRDDGVTKIPHEIEYYENDSGIREIYAWVKVPKLFDNSNTTIYMYYGNMASSTQEDAANVWDDGYTLVMHLNEDVAVGGTTGIHYDSTRNGSNGVQHENALEDHTIYI